MHVMSDNVLFSAHTPMMQQYYEIKIAHQDCLLFYRLGDFYELLAEDAIIASAILDVVLTKRHKGTANEIAMCGVPAHSHEYYLQKLIQSGYKVAICEQLETPEQAKKRGHKAVVRREVVRIVTPGTVLEDKLLPQKENVYLTCIAEVKVGEMAMACLDLTTGQIYINTTSASSLATDILRMEPREILTNQYVLEHYQLFNFFPKQKISTRNHSLFDFARCLKRVQDVYRIKDINVLGDLTPPQIVALGVLLEYVEHTQKQMRVLLKKPQLLVHHDFLQIDANTRRHLDISQANERHHSFFYNIDKTLTAAGGRLLYFYLQYPLAHHSSISNRLDVVSWFLANNALLLEVRHNLRNLPDLERTLAKICMGKGKLNELLKIKQGLETALLVMQQCKSIKTSRPTLLEQQLGVIADFNGLLYTLHQALRGEVSDDWMHMIRPGYNPLLDEMITLAHSGTEALSELQDRYREQYNISNLKISHNNIVGHFLEVTNSHITKVPNDWVVKQTTTNAKRYISSELIDLTNKLDASSAQAEQLVQEILHELNIQVIACSESISLAAEAMAFIDVFTSFALLAQEHNLCRPEIVEEPILEIIAGRHLVLEKNGNFISNDTKMLADENIYLLTGPNMAGKSTYMRQNALIILLAQIGSFVPASAVKMGVVDKLFTRIGAADDIAKGNSTFMVEMIEMAYILHNATNRSFVIVDEIGRGTSTQDGLAIAAAVLEDIANRIKCRTMFSTHYHELTAWEKDLANVSCYHMQVYEDKNQIVFLHKIARGKADKAYGLHVAAIAGIPKSVLDRAQKITQNS